jgi:hypothetical protein
VAVKPATPAAFVPLKALSPKAAAPAATLAEIRAIYFKTSAATIDADLQHAIALLMSLPDEETRERATVYMEGLNDMRKEWAGRKTGGGGARRKAAGRPARKPAAGKTAKRR